MWFRVSDIADHNNLNVEALENFVQHNMDKYKAIDDYGFRVSTMEVDNLVYDFKTVNQCDGCCQMLTLRKGMHIDKNGNTFMACSALKYTGTTKG